VIGAVTTVVVLGAVAEVMSFLFYAGSGEGRPSLVSFAQVGGLIFFFFHHVGITCVGSTGSCLPGILEGATDTIAAAALLGTFVGLWLLSSAGRKIGEEAGGSGWMRGLAGAKVAVPYAVLTLAVASVSRIPRDALDPNGSPAIHPSYVGALLWPLALAALAGFAGGFRSAGVERWSVGSVGRHVRGAVAGGAWMMGLAMILAFAGLLILAPTHPQDTASYFSTFDDKFAQGLALVFATLLAVPNLAAGLILFPAMGSCLSVSGNLVGVNASVCLLSWDQFPGRGGNGLDFGSPPPVYFLYLLVPLLAVVIGGRMAARRGRATTRQEAVAMGSLAGVVYGLLAALLAILITISIEAVVRDESFTARLGPELFPGLLWPFLWGIVGGAIGGAMETRSYASAPLEEPSEEGATVPTAG
jgi:uncharacterized protein DUF6350